MSSSNESQIDVTDFVLNYSKANSEDRRVIVRMVQEFAAKAFSEEATDEADEAVDILQQIAHGVPDITWSEAIAITTAIATIKKPTPELIDLLITNLAGSRTKWIRVAAADELGKLRQEAHKALPALMECVLPEDLLTFDVRRHAFEAITAIGSTEVVKELVASKMQPPEKYGSFLVKEDLGTDVLGDIWGDNPELALRYVVAALKVQYDQPRPEAAAAWLRERAPAIPENSKISELLKKQLVDQLKSWKLRENYRPKVRQLLEETLSLLEGLTTIQTWIKWIEAGDPTSLAQAEIQAQQLRSDPNAVYYLVSEFERWEMSTGNQPS